MTTVLPTKLAAALVKAQSDLTHVGKSKAVSIKTKTGGTISYKYAELHDVIDACRAALAPHGLTFFQPVIADASMVRVRTTIMHESGESISDDGVPIAADLRDAKSVGSAITYARRYGLASMVGIAQADDDGKASRRKPDAAPKPSVNLAPKAKRDALEAAIKALPDPYPKQIGNRMRAEAVVWTQLTIEQLAEVQAWHDECAEIAGADAS